MAGSRARRRADTMTAPVFSSQDLSARTVRHMLSAPRATQHLVHVRTLVGGLQGRESATLALPVWAPGSYKVRDFSKNLLDLTARDPETSRPLPVAKARKNAWRVELGGARAVEVEYDVYGFELSV